MHYFEYMQYDIQIETVKINCCRLFICVVVVTDAAAAAVFVVTCCRILMMSDSDYYLSSANRKRLLQITPSQIILLIRYLGMHTTIELFVMRE